MLEIEVLLFIVCVVYEYQGDLKIDHKLTFNVWFLFAQNESIKKNGNFLSRGCFWNFYSQFG